MLPVKMTNATRTLGAPTAWDDSETECLSLDIYDYETDNGNVMSSAWMLSEEEVAALRNNSIVYLHIHGVRHPVVSLTVQGT